MHSRFSYWDGNTGRESSIVNAVAMVVRGKTLKLVGVVGRVDQVTVGGRRMVVLVEWMRGQCKGGVR